MSKETVVVHILGQDYKVACSPGERDSLLRAASELDRRMRDIRQVGNVVGVERIAVMAALNLANELLQSDSSSYRVDQALLTELHQRIDRVLS